MTGLFGLEGYEFFWYMLYLRIHGKFFSFEHTDLGTAYKKGRLGMRYVSFSLLFHSFVWQRYTVS